MNPFETAAAYLRLLNDSAEMQRVRRKLAAAGYPVARMDDRAALRLYFWMQPPAAVLRLGPVPRGSVVRRSTPTLSSPPPRAVSASTGASARPLQTVPPGLASEPPSAPPEQTWVEIRLVAEDGEPIPRERYIIELSNGIQLSGCLDADGLARVEGLSPGNCKVTFPDMDAAAWSGVDQTL